MGDININLLGQYSSTIFYLETLWYVGYDKVSK